MSQEITSHVLGEMIALCEDGQARYTWAAQQAAHADLTVTFNVHARERTLDRTEFGQLRLQLDTDHTTEQCSRPDRLTWDAWQESDDVFDDTKGTPYNQLIAVCMRGEELIQERCAALGALALPLELAARIEQQQQKAVRALALLRPLQPLPTFSVNSTEKQAFRVAESS